MAGLLIMPLYIREKWHTQRIPSDWFGLLLIGLFGVTLNQVFFLIGLSRTSVVHSVLIISITPILVLVIASAMGQERVTARKAIGMLIAVSGVAILTSLPSPSRQQGPGPSITGDLFIFLAGLTFALFTVLGRKVSARHTPVTVNTFGFVGGALVARLPLLRSRCGKRGGLTSRESARRGGRASRTWRSSPRWCRT
jgi:drug/metabolite transporter (DMT)-like permease